MCSCVPLEFGTHFWYLELCIWNSAFHLWLMMNGNGSDADTDHSDHDDDKKKVMITIVIELMV